MVLLLDTMLQSNCVQGSVDQNCGRGDKFSSNNLSSQWSNHCGATIKTINFLLAKYMSCTDDNNRCFEISIVPFIPHITFMDENLLYLIIKGDPPVTLVTIAEMLDCYLVGQK